MNDQEQNIVIAKACGHGTNDITQDIDGTFWRRDKEGWSVPVESYTSDLNAMHEAEKNLTKAQWEDYGDWLEKMIDPVKGWLHATAAQRAEAFLRTIGKWEGAK